MADAPEVGRLARSVYLRFATPAFVVSFVSGVVRILATPQDYAHAHWLHAKLGAALVIIIAHHVIGARARKIASGNTEAADDLLPLRISVLLASAAVVALVVFRSALIP
jgi:putative membrane protein